ncbi:ABC transporter permease subunit [Colwellia sp. UCD-KL20]|uniref:ABC transporter permease subunit n=1 Tax=Colwellia sp. UCD-KL20 TaxID=1917165 RepID=UPI001178AE6E|nr:ABC transporter permease subunit [Colwellia sp. UCD-KL20]
MYLLYVIKPVFDSATVEQTSQLSLTSSTKTLSVGVDELKEVAYQINELGDIRFYRLTDKNGHKIGSQLFSQQLVSNGGEIKHVVDSGINYKLIVDSNNNNLVIAPKFQSVYTADSREIIARIDYPLGEEPLELDENNASFSKVAFAMDSEKAVFVAKTNDGRLIKTTLLSEDSFDYDPAFDTIFQEIEFYSKKVDEILITPDLSLAFVQSGNTISVFELDDEDNVTLKTEIKPKTTITSMALLSGSSSILIGDNKGQISQWFEVAGESGRDFQKIRSFNNSTGEVVAKIYTEQFRKSFYGVTATGTVDVFYTTSEAQLWNGKLVSNQPDAFAVSPRSDAIIVVNNNDLKIFSVHNEHPEVTWSALWNEVWYEGYAEPDYIWQSTSGTDDFEAKFSLVPISFGTIKAAFYAMLFAVPIALTAAIYTAYFMTPALRKKVKPTIELMEALPTVILGFLAGLWLAPLIESYLPAIFLMVIFLPLSTLIAALAWYKLPKELKIKIPETLAPVILIPVILVSVYFAFALSPVLELHMFGGDVRQYITNELGINFDQRNALVVGIAMGFAVIPTIFTMAEDAIFSVPRHLTSGSLALGATQWQTLIKVVLLTASPGIFSALMMGLGRAVGETMIVLMATGNTPILDWSIFQGMRTLAANIAVEMPESEVGSSHYRILFLAAFVLFVFTFVVNTLAEFIRQRLRDKYSSL